MKRVLILLLFVLVVGCAEKPVTGPDTGPDSDWECPSCHWGVGKKAVKCPNCKDVFESLILMKQGNPVDIGNLPVRREN
jgi:hypothetical protein